MQKRAFTLIELLVVIVIIGLLTVVATTSFLHAQSTSRDTTRKSSVQAIANALEAYKLTNQTYPGTVDASDATTCRSRTSASTFAYYDYPPEAATGCQPSSLFQPIPNWIPGLGRYLNPAPQEPRYQGADGGTASVGSFDSKGQVSGTGNLTRTYSYQKTATGYYVNAELEQGGGTIYSVSK